MSDLIARAADRASDRPFFLASALKQYQHEKEVSRENLAIQLGCTTETLDKLALCRKPETSTELEQIAQYTGIELEKLAEISRTPRNLPRGS
ncbi:hypothetical protein ACQ4M3_13050 [Leptolyngbya sp. AN03gr2]|uniref:hypothetical protein n=1 Tax=unclassified Leptolyngbya TaxID=2650499 RepID=UPI003D310547